MTTAPLAVLDQAELLKLALEANRSSNRGIALAYLKEAVSRFDATATAHYLLGAEYAQIQMFDRAVTEMDAAIALDPGLHIARLQLGLLLMGAGAAGQALSVLQPLTDLGMESPLHYLGYGLIHLIRNQFQQATSNLIKGIALNSQNPPLNVDMQKLIDEIAKLPNDVLAKSGGTDELPVDPSARHIFLSAYTANRNQ